jgi:hypothetical protein
LRWIFQRSAGVKILPWLDAWFSDTPEIVFTEWLPLIEANRLLMIFFIVLFFKVF